MAWTALSDGYSVELAITVWAAEDMLSVPVSAVFRHGESWVMYAQQNGVARLTPVEVGRRDRTLARVDAHASVRVELLMRQE